MFTKILISIALITIIVFFIVLIVMTIFKKIASSKVAVNLAFTKLMQRKCENKPNKTMVFTCKDGSLLICKIVPKNNGK